MSNTSIDRVRRRIRQKVRGTAEKPRLSVFRSNAHIYAQLIDDVLGKTIVSSSTLDPIISSELGSTSTCEAASLVGQLLAKKCSEVNITTVVFDRGGRLYHGRIKALADAAREKGLKF
jgi:large subunit ribosomal protein L18